MDYLFVMDPLNQFPDPLGHMDTPLKTTASHNFQCFWTLDPTAGEPNS